MDNIWFDLLFHYTTVSGHKQAKSVSPVISAAVNGGEIMQRIFQAAMTLFLLSCQVVSIKERSDI